MDTLEALLTRTSPADRDAVYDRMACAALEQYDLPELHPVFIQHNGGITYRLVDPTGSPRYLLKAAQPAGENDATPPERLQLVLEWVAALSVDTDIPVQVPMPNRAGDLLTYVDIPGLAESPHWFVQQWLEGRHDRGPFTPAIARRVGEMVGRLHSHSARWTGARQEHAIQYDDTSLQMCLEELAPVVDLGIVTAAQWKVVEAALARIAGLLHALGRSPQEWGAIHGDLNHDNLLFAGDTVMPIDFDDFRVSHFPYDLGVLLYHLLYQRDPAVFRALLDGYRAVRPLPDHLPLWPEAFVCSAALGNLSFQVTLPEQRVSPHFARNVRQFVDVFCASLAEGRPFVFSPA